MSTYTDLHNRIKENVTILRKPGSKDDGMSPQKVILINPENQFYGTFNGAMNIKSGTLSDLAFVGGTIDGTKIKNATFLDGDVEVPIGEIAAAVDSHEQRLTQAEADIKAISAAHNSLSAGLSSAVDDLSVGIEEKIDAAVEDIDKRISGAVSGLEDLSGDVIGLSSALSDIALNGVVYKGTLLAYHDTYDNPGQLFGDNPACCLLEGHQNPLKNGWMWRVHVDPGNVSGYVVVEDKTGKSTTLGEGDYIIIKSHNPSEHEVIPDGNMLLDDFDMINAQDGDDAKLSVILKLSSEVMGISAEISGLSSDIAEDISSAITAQIDAKFVHKDGDRIDTLTVDNDLVVDGSLCVVGDDISVSVTDDGLSVKTTEPIAIETVRKVTVSTPAPLELSASRLLANFRNTVELSVNDGLAKIQVNGKSIQSTLDDLSNALDASKFDKDFGEQVSSQVTAIQKYVDELSGDNGSEGIIKDLSDEISVLRRDEKFELQLNKVDFWTPEDADGRYSSIGHFLCALLEPTTNDVRNNTGYVVEFGASVPLSTKILISDGRGTTLGHGDTIYIHELSSVESAPIRIPFAKLQPYDRANKSGNAFILQAGVSRYEFEGQSKNLSDEISARVAADDYISSWISRNFANTREDNELTTTVLNQEISAKSSLSVDGVVYALNDLSAAKQLFVNNGQLAVANDGERTSVEAVADIVKINNALSASQDIVSVDFSKTVDSSLGVSIIGICVGLSVQIDQLSIELSTQLSNEIETRISSDNALSDDYVERIGDLSDALSIQLSDEIETRKLDDAFLSNAISSKIWIEDRANDPSDISGYGDLSVVKISKDEYEDLAIGPTRLCANVLYVVESDYVDAYGQEIRNVLSADSETNAATVGQVGAAKAELCAYAGEISAQASAELSRKLDLSGGMIETDVEIVPLRVKNKIADASYCGIAFETNDSGEYDAGGDVGYYFDPKDKDNGHLVIGTNIVHVKVPNNQEAANGTLAIAATNPTAGDLATLDANGNPIDSGLSKDDVENLFFAQYYPEGNVKSTVEFTPGIKYDDPNTTARTITVKPFCNTGNSDKDNSSLAGRIVIPPFVDMHRNPYITDDGTRYRVVGVSGISNAPADNNTKLTGIIAPNTVTNIDGNAFRRCTSLASVSLPSVMTIGNRAFSGCSALTSASLPDATTVGEFAFEYCRKLTYISLPSATNIGSHAFDNCITLTSVDFGDTTHSDIPSLGADAFSSVPTTCKIIIPDAQYDAWVAAPSWSDLVTAGYMFLHHSEWEYARKYEIVPTSRMVNNKSLSVDIVLTGEDIKANNSSNWTLSQMLNQKVPLLEDGNGIRNAVTIGTEMSGKTLGSSSFRQGDSNAATGPSAHAQGYRTQATGNNSHSEGNETVASGNGSHSEGNTTQASGLFSHAEGSNVTTASGEAAHAEGGATQASGLFSHSEGYSTKATARVAHAEGNLTEAAGEASHAEGFSVKAEGIGAHAEGSGLHGVAEMLRQSADQAEAAGAPAESVAQIRAVATLFADNETSTAGDFSHTEGFMAGTGGLGSHADGYRAVDGGNPFSFVWQGLAETQELPLPTHTELMELIADPSSQGGQAAINKIVKLLQGTMPYQSKGPGTFCIKPAGDDPKAGFYVGDESLRNMLDAKISVDSIPADVNMVHISQKDYEQLVFDGGALSNTFYVVSGECINAYGEPIKNAVMTDDPEESEAATQHYVLSGLAGKQDTIADLDDIRLSAQDALPASISSNFVLKSQIQGALSAISADPLSSLTYTSMLSDVISSVVVVRNMLSSLIAVIQQ